MQVVRMFGGTPRIRSALRRARPHAPALLLALLALLIGIAVNLALFPLLSWNADEGVYLAQAEALRAGQLTWPAATHGDLLRPWLTGEAGGAYFTKYLPGYPALLAAALWLTGSPVLVPAFSAALLVLASYTLALVLFGERRTALIAAGLTVASPLVIIHSGLYLTYTVTTAVLFLAAACSVRGAQTGSRGLLLTAGALGGAAVLLRQYDVALVALPVAAYVLLRHGRTARRIVPLVGWPVLGAVPALAVVLAYNTAVTGSPLRFPLPATDPLDTFGFGPRRMLPTEPPLDFTPGQAVEALAVHLAAVPGWLTGGLVLVFLAGVALWRGDPQRRPQRLLLLGLVAIFPIGYFPFWGPALAADLGLDALGPYYYTPALMALTVLGAAGADTVIRAAVTGTRRPEWTRVAVSGLAVLAAVLTAESLLQNLRAQDYYRDRAAAVAAAIPPASRLETPAVVFVDDPDGRPYVGQPYPFLRNDPELRNPVLYAVTLGAPDRRIFSLLPGRAVYALRLPLLARGGDLRVPGGSFVRLHAVRGPAVELRTTVRAPVTGTCLTAFAALGDAVRTRTLTCQPLEGGTYDVQWRVGPGGDLPLPDGDAVLVTGVVAGPEGAGPTSPDASVWEERHSFGVDRTPAGPVAEIVVPGEPWRGSTENTPRWDPQPVGDVLRTTAVSLP